MSEVRVVEMTDKRRPCILGELFQFLSILHRINSRRRDFKFGVFADDVGNVIINGRHPADTGTGLIQLRQLGVFAYKPVQG
mmetsp:Transcript_211/g.404  ORF Transcript_211/g.404 Transcript_211/m.404 type:complete len:81 (+) Transcript_211:491-733(+)